MGSRTPCEGVPSDICALFVLAPADGHEDKKKQFGWQQGALPRSATGRAPFSDPDYDRR
jgi:hypothetical protein